MARTNKYTERRRKIKKYGIGARLHWDPKNPNHIHIDKNGNILPANYSGSDNAYSFEITDDTPKDIIEAINAHRIAMDDDKYKYIVNPEYEKLRPAIENAKTNYEWGKENWSRYYPSDSKKFKLPLTFDENGIGYKNGQTYLPINKQSNEAVSIPVPSNISFSQYADYIPVKIPAEKILRTDFPNLPYITSNLQKQEKERAVAQYIKDNTSSQIVYNRPVESYLWINPDTNMAQWMYEPLYNAWERNDDWEDGWDGAEYIEDSYRYGKEFRLPDDFDTVPLLKDPDKTISDYATKKFGAFSEKQFDDLYNKEFFGYDKFKTQKDFSNFKNKYRRTITMRPSKEEAEKNAKINLLNLINKTQKGGVIHDNMGQWKYPGMVTSINGNKGKTSITMQGVPYPVLGISDKGDTKIMLPGMDYLFKGNEVTEYPLVGKAQFGNWLKETARKIIDSEARNAPSYSKDEISFANAFNDARNKGANKFYWDGKYYNTVKKEELDENNELKKDVYFPSYNIREKIKEFEGYKPNVYLDGNGIETIGYGFTDKDIVNKYRDSGITREAAEEIFNDYINSFVGELKGTPHFDELNQNQRDALLSYIYNIGSTNYFENSDLMQGALRDRNWEEVARQMDYGYNDKNNTGLRKRRDYEQKLFLTPVKQEGGYAPSYFLANQQMNVNKPDTASTSGIYASKWPTRDTAIANGVANGSSQQAFYEDMFHSLTDYMKEHGIEENVGRPTAYNIIAHHAMESSSGGRLPAAFNYGGIRLTGSTNYKKFDGIDNFIKDYMENTIGGRSVFEQAMNGNAMSFEDYMKTLKNNGYFEADLDTYTRNAKNDGYMRAKRFLDDIPYQTGGEIHIKEKNRGKFTEAAKRAGKSVQAYAAQILANKENYSPTLIKRAVFAKNAAGWKHQDGGIGKYLEGNYVQPQTVGNVMNSWNDMLAKVTVDADKKASLAGTILNAVATSASGALSANSDNIKNSIADFKNVKEARKGTPITEHQSQQLLNQYGIDLSGIQGRVAINPNVKQTPSTSLSNIGSLNISNNVQPENFSLQNLLLPNWMPQNNLKWNKKIKIEPIIKQSISNPTFSLPNIPIINSKFLINRKNRQYNPISTQNIEEKYQNGKTVNKEYELPYANLSLNRQIYVPNKNGKYVSLTENNEYDTEEEAIAADYDYNIEHGWNPNLSSKEINDYIFNMGSYNVAANSSFNECNPVSGMNDGNVSCANTAYRGSFADFLRNQGKNVGFTQQQINTLLPSLKQTYTNSYLSQPLYKKKNIKDIELLEDYLQPGDLILKGRNTKGNYHMLLSGTGFVDKDNVITTNESHGLSRKENEDKYGQKLTEKQSRNLNIENDRIWEKDSLLNTKSGYNSPVRLRPSGWIDLLFPNGIKTKEDFIKFRKIYNAYNRYARDIYLKNGKVPSSMEFVPVANVDNFNSTNKAATGGNTAQLAEIERGEIVSTPTGDSIANGLMDYHELYDNQNEKKKNIVNLTNNMVKDVLHNPQLSSITERVNKYTAMRRNGKTFIFPSTVGTNGEILEPQVGANYWLAKLINKK